MVEFKVARMNDGAFRRVQTYADGIRNTVVRFEEDGFNRTRAALRSRH